MSNNDLPVLAPVKRSDLPELARYQGCTAEDLLPMLAASQAQCHEGRYYRQFSVYRAGQLVGCVSLAAQTDCSVSAGVEIFPPFQRSGLGFRAMLLLMDKAREQGYTLMTSQVRTDNAASIALHRRLGFAPGEVWRNRRGREVRTWQKDLNAMHHQMSLRPSPFDMMASGCKRYELRLLDEKRRLISVGDTITFVCTEDARHLCVRVTSLQSFADFAQLYAALPLTACGYTPQNVSSASPKDMEAYYPPEKQARYGVLAIGVELVGMG